MRRIIYIIICLTILCGCSDLLDRNHFEQSLHNLTVTAVYPQGHENSVKAGVEVNVEEMTSGSRYVKTTDASGTAVLRLPNGLYRVTLSDRDGSDIFNGTADRVALSDKDVALNLSLSWSKAGTIVIKELYCGGCKKLPLEGDWQADQYFILHNNDYQVQYLDSLCFGTLSPYNSTASNPWVKKDPDTGENVFQDFLPVIQAVWQFPGDGDDFPLQPGEDAVVCLRGAVDHTAQYPLSVNLNKPGYFVCYNTTYFPNPTFHPAPGDQISPDRYLKVVIKTGQANAYTVSISSPTLVLFRAKGIAIEDFVKIADNVIPVPGSTVDNVVKVPLDWVTDALEVFDGRSSNNLKRLPPMLDAGYVLQTDIYLGRSLMRKTDEAATASAGYVILADSNYSLNDFYETSAHSLND